MPKSKAAAKAKDATKKMPAKVRGTNAVKKTAPAAGGMKAGERKKPRFKPRAVLWKNLLER